jgi:hypothetical protein
MRIDRPEHYYRVGLERIKQAWLLYNEPNHGSYALAMYVAGVAVESMLRAFKIFRDPVFDERHDLLRLFKASGMLNLDPDLLKARGLSTSQVEAYFRELQAATSDVYDLWSNDYRFATEERMRAHLKNKRLDRKIRGDFLKKRSLELLEASQTIIDKGLLQWILLKRSSPF